MSDILRDLARARAAFQLRTIEAIITERPMNAKNRAPNKESAANTNIQTMTCNDRADD